MTSCRVSFNGRLTNRYKVIVRMVSQGSTHSSRIRPTVTFYPMYVLREGKVNFVPAHLIFFWRDRQLCATDITGIVIDFSRFRIRKISSLFPSRNCKETAVEIHWRWERNI